MNTKSVQTLVLAAAFAGMMGGVTARMNAQSTSGQTATTTTASAHAGVLLVQDKPLPKHACKGQNDCKGQGGGKHPGKNSCKGKGGCATDGSTPPSFA